MVFGVSSGGLLLGAGQRNVTRRANELMAERNLVDRENGCKAVRGHPRSTLVCWEGSTVNLCAEETREKS